MTVMWYFGPQLQSICSAVECNSTANTENATDVLHREFIAVVNVQFVSLDYWNSCLLLMKETMTEVDPRSSLVQQTHSDD